MQNSVPADGLYLEFDGHALDVSGKSFKLTHNQTQYDSSAFADAYKSTGPGKKMIEASVDVLMLKAANGGSTQMTALALGNEGSLLWGKEGNGTGKPKMGFTARVADVSQSFDTDSAAVYNVKFTMAGTDLLFNEASDTWS